MGWTPERTWEPYDMETAGRFNTMVRDNLKMLRYRPAFRGHSVEDQQPDANGVEQRMLVTLIRDPALTSDYDRELVTSQDGYYDSAGGSYVTARRGIYVLGASASISAVASDSPLLQLLIVNDVTNRVVGGRTSVATATSTPRRTGLTVTTTVPAKADDAFRVDFTIFSGVNGVKLESDVFYSTVVWGHWVKDWPNTAVIF